MKSKKHILDNKSELMFFLKKWCKITVPAFVLIVLLLYAMNCFAEADAEKSIKIFLESLSKGEISRIECYYLEWGDLTNSLSEKELLEGRYDYRVIVNSAPIGHMLKFQKTFQALVQVKKLNIQKSLLDCRMLFLFYKQDKEMLRVSFIKNVPVMLINGKSYNVSTELLTILLQILPHNAYEGTQAIMLESWSYSEEK